MSRDPGLAFGVEVVARTVIDHEEDFPPHQTHEQLEEVEEGVGIE